MTTFEVTLTPEAVEISDQGDHLFTMGASPSDSIIVIDTLEVLTYDGDDQEFVEMADSIAVEVDYERFMTLDILMRDTLVVNDQFAFMSPLNVITAGDYVMFTVSPTAPGNVRFSGSIEDGGMFVKADSTMYLYDRIVVSAGLGFSLSEEVTCSDVLEVELQ